MRRLNKKGAEMTIGTLVVIVLAIIVLVVLALGFGMGWSNLWSKIIGYFGGGSNVDSIKQACSYACTTQATYDYCCAVREVKYEKDGVASRLTCDSEGLMGIGKCENTKCDGANANVCSAVKCAANQVKDDCAALETKDASKILDSTGVPIPENKFCCKVAVAKICTATTTICTALTDAECPEAKKVCDYTATAAAGSRCKATSTVCAGLSDTDCSAAKKVCIWS